MDVARLRAAFPVLRETAYLNAGTCGPVPEVALDAAVEALRSGAADGRGVAFYERVHELTDGLRERYARLLGAGVEDVALTAGTSDGVARVVAGLRLGAGDEVLTADDEHPGLLGALMAAQRCSAITVRTAPLAQIADAVDDRTRLIACSHVAWSSGAFAPDLREVARTIPVLLDGAQGLGAVPIDVHALGVQFYAGSGQKWLCGPVGTGALWVAPAWHDRLGLPAVPFPSLATPAAGLDSALVPGALRFDSPSMDLSALAAAVAAFDVLDAAGWPAVQDRARALAATLAQRLAAAGLRVIPRGDSTLVAWATDDDATALATRERLAAEGVVIRDLPGAARLRASVGGWSDEQDLDRLVAALGAG
jgi:L-cysteine/cystine lyase